MLFAKELNTINNSKLYMSVNRVEQMKNIQAEALELFTRKRTPKLMIGVLMRIEDKIQRFCL